MPNPNDRKGIFWFLRKKKSEKKERGTLETNTSESGNNRAFVVQPSSMPPNDTPPPQPNTTLNLIKKKKKRISPLKGKTVTEDDQEQMGASTKFVSVKAKMRPAPTKMRKRQLVLGKEKSVDEDKILDKKDVAPETEHEDEKTEDHDQSDGKSSEDTSVRLPVVDDKEGVKQLLCRNRRLEKENGVLKKLFRELKAQMDEQQEQLDRHTAELYDFVKGSTVAAMSDRSKEGFDDKAGSSSGNTKLSNVPEKKESSDVKKPPVTNKPPTDVESKSPMVIKKPPVVNKLPNDPESVDATVNKKHNAVDKPQNKPESKDGFAKKPEIKMDVNPVPVTTTVTYKKTFHMFRGKLVPRYTPVIVSAVPDVTTTPMVQIAGAKADEKNRNGSK